jgi:hypothetical protein
MKNENIIVIIILIAVMFLLITHLSTNILEFSRYNTGWNGTSGFFNLPDRHNTEDIFNTSLLQGRKNTTLLMIAPREKYHARDLTEYRSFVEEGNTLFLADDFGAGNKILQGIGSSIIIIPGILSSVDRVYNQSYTVVTYPFLDHPINKDVSSLVLNKGATLEGGEPLMKTTLMSWIDTDNDGRITKKEYLGKFTVLTHESIGKGEVFVLSDPSIFTNKMGTIEEKWGNHQFIRNVIKLNNHLLIDQICSRTADTDGFSAVMQNMKNYPLFTLLFIGMMFFSLVIIIQKRIL